MKNKLIALERDLLSDNMAHHAEFIPLVDEKDEDILLKDDSIPNRLPILPLKGNVLFPGNILPIFIGRKSSLKLMREACEKHFFVGVATQVDDVDSPQMEDLFSIGTVGRVMKVMEIPHKGTMAVVQGVMKFELLSFEYVENQYYWGDVKLIDELVAPKHPQIFKANMKVLRKQFAQLMKSKRGVDDALGSMAKISSDKVMINFVSNEIDAPVLDRQLLLEAEGYEKRLESLLTLIQDELQYISLQDEIQKKAQRSMDRQQREYMLQQQMRAIQSELGGSPMDEDVQELVERANKKHLTNELRQVFEKELRKLQHSPMQSPDYTVQLNYLNEFLDMPWNEYTKDNLSIRNVKKVLDRDHYGIEKVKERILEQVAIMRLNPSMNAPILCLVGPPGTGKTSLGKSIAEALGRKYVRVALGGLHDESEIRGHRRTYVGAMSGRILKGLKRAGSSNPVFILDEIDKVQTQTHQGDPTSALLEVLDPEQNNAFHDNYIEVDYDLSKVMFIATANNLQNIQPALLDRMEVIDLNGYILEEKIEIANRHLMPRLLKNNGLTEADVSIQKDAMVAIINNYTRESGVRQLEKQLAQIVRKKGVELVSKKWERGFVCEGHLQHYLGLPIHNSEVKGDKDRVGVVTGLAWTSVGGEILFVESSLSKGKGTMTMTGNLGDVMKESATLAYEYLKANAATFGVKQEDIDNSNLHIHVPEGATPKDGPSAGITMFVSMLSSFTNKPVRNDLAMTGEITLRGKVTPVGGIKEKILAAKRAGINNIMLSESNKRDIEDIPQKYLKGMQFHYINEMSDALPLVFKK